MITTCKPAAYSPEIRPQTLLCLYFGNPSRNLIHKRAAMTSGNTLWYLGCLVVFVGTSLQETRRIVQGDGTSSNSNHSL